MGKTELLDSINRDLTSLPAADVPLDPRSPAARAAFSDPEALFRLGQEPAARLRWEVGREIHGPDWVGAARLLEANVELVDFRVYLRDAVRTGEIHPSRAKLVDRLILMVAELISHDIRRYLDQADPPRHHEDSP